ncbi:unnamed protein product [Caenorhabditis brenneri]
MTMYRCQFPDPVVCTVVMNSVEMGEHFGRHTGCYTMRCHKCNTLFVSIDVYREHKNWCHPTPSDVEAYQTPDRLHVVHENCYRHFVVPATKKETADGRGVVQWHLYQNGHQQLQELYDFQKAHPNQANYENGFQGYNNSNGPSTGPQPLQYQSNDWRPRNSASGASYNPYQNQRYWNPGNYNGGWNRGVGNRGGWHHRGGYRGGRGGGRGGGSRGASWYPLISDQDNGDSGKENDQNREQPSTPTRPAHPPTPFTSPGELAPLQIVSPPDTPTQGSGTEGFPLVEDPQEMPQSPVDEVAPQAAETTLPSPTSTEPAPESAQDSPVDAIPLPSGTEDVSLLLPRAVTPTADFEAQPEELSAPAEQHQDVVMIGKAPDSSETSVLLPLEIVPPQSPLEADLAEQDAPSAQKALLQQAEAESVLPSPAGLAARTTADLAVQPEEQPVQEAPRTSETPVSPLAELAPQAEQDALFVLPSPSPPANLAVQPEEQPAPDEPIIAQAPKDSDALLPLQAENVPESQPRNQSDDDDVVFVCEVKKANAPRPAPAADIAVQPEGQPAPTEQAVQMIAQAPSQAENVPESQPRDQSDDDDVIFVCEVKKAPRPPLPPPPPAPKIHPPHVIIDLGPLPELPMPPPMTSPNENLPSTTAKNGPPAWLRCNKWADLKEKLPAELEAQLTPDQRRGYIGSMWTERPEPAQSPPGLHDDSQLSHSPEISEAPAPSHPVQQKSSGSYRADHHVCACNFIGRVRITIGADGEAQKHGEFSQSPPRDCSCQKSSGDQEKSDERRQESGEQGRHGAQTLKIFEDPDRQLTPTPERQSSSSRPNSQNTHTPGYRDTLGSPVLSSPEGSPPAPVSSKPRGSKSVSFSEPLVQCCYLQMKSQEVEYQPFVGKKTEKRVSTSSIPSVPPPVKKVATVPPAKIPAKAPAKAPRQNDNILDSIFAGMSEPTIKVVERKNLAPAKAPRENFMAKKGFTFGKK